MPWTWSRRFSAGSWPRGLHRKTTSTPQRVEFLQDQDLISIFAREPIRVEDVEAVDGPGGGLVPESLEARADQDAAAVAVVDEPQFGVAFQGVARRAAA